MTDAIHREDVIKGWSRDKKNKLIAQKNPDWIFLDPNKPEFPILTTKEEESIPLDPQQRGHSDDRREEGPSSPDEGGIYQKPAI